jgi:hypothetical protein
LYGLESFSDEVFLRAKQQKKSQARRTPRAAEPRMYGDGKPSQPENAQQAAPAAPASTQRAATGRTAGMTPRGAGAAGSYARIDRIADYSYVVHDLRRLGIVAASILAGLVVLGFIVR